MADPLTYTRERYQKRMAAMKQEMQSFIDHWKLLSEFVKPRRGRFEMQDRNRGDRRHQSIINSRATRAQQTAVAGMFNGTMAASRPWLVLETDDPGFMEFGPTKKWFSILQDRMRRLLNDSNLYTNVPIMLDEELLFGTGCMAHEDDPLDLMRFWTPTIGSYVISQGHDGRVNTLGRWFEMTVEQIVSKFSVHGEVSKSISPAVRQQYAEGNYDAWYPVHQFVHPNPDFVIGSDDPTKRTFRSVYYEEGNNDKDAFLETNGYHEFPFYSPRWEITGEDIYGTSCPGMVALGDIRQLQMEERRKAQGIDKMVAPVLHGPAALRSVPIRNEPAGATLYDSGDGSKGLRPVYEVKLPISELTLDIKEVENRINEAYFVDLFRAISAMRGVQPRNELELLQRNQERLVELGPILERQYTDFQNALVARVFGQMWREGLVPPPPVEIQGRPLRPRYVSSLALAQNAITTGNIERLFSFINGLAANPGYAGVTDKADGDQAVDEYARLIGAPMNLVIPDEQVAQTREARAQQLAMQQSAALAEQGSNIAKMASDAKLGDDNVASRLLGRGEAT